MAGVSVELAPELRVRGHGEENEASWNGQLHGAAEQTGVVSDVLDDVEEADQIEGPRERRLVPPRGDEARGAANPRQSEVVDSGIEPDGSVVPRQLREDFAVPAADVEDPGAGRVQAEKPAPPRRMASRRCVNQKWPSLTSKRRPGASSGKPETGGESVRTPRSYKAVP